MLDAFPGQIENCEKRQMIANDFQLTTAPMCSEIWQPIKHALQQKAAGNCDWLVTLWIE